MIFVLRVQISAHNSRTVVLIKTQKLPFFVGAGGIPFFRIPPSLAGMNPGPLDPKISTFPLNGDFRAVSQISIT